MKYCAHCGAEIYDQSVICTKCGCAVDDSKSSGISTSNNYNTLAIVGFALSFFSTIVGLILSIIAYRQVKTTGEKGKEFALAGIIISSVQTAFVVIFLIIYFAILILAIGSIY